jgi:hypothetical protein
MKTLEYEESLQIVACRSVQGVTYLAKIKALRAHGAREGLWSRL